MKTTLLSLLTLTVVSVPNLVSAQESTHTTTTILGLNPEDPFPIRATARNQVKLIRSNAEFLRGNMVWIFETSDQSEDIEENIVRIRSECDSLRRTFESRDWFLVEPMRAVVADVDALADLIKNTRTLMRDSRSSLNATSKKPTASATMVLNGLPIADQRMADMEGTVGRLKTQVRLILVAAERADALTGTVFSTRILRGAR